MQLTARARPHGDPTADVHTWTVEADTYEQALAEARAGVADGWDLLSIM